MASEDVPKGEVAADADPAPKRVKLSGADPIEGVVNPALLAPASVEALKASYASAEPYLHCVFTEPFDPSLLANVRDEIINNINATYKETDLFKLFQTGGCRPQEESLHMACLGVVAAELATCTHKAPPKHAALQQIFWGSMKGVGVKAWP